MTQPDRRFIEETFPVKDVSQHAANEKNIRHGHISTLHIWWARRPLAASRATAYAALVPAAEDIMAERAQFHRGPVSVGQLAQHAPAGARPPRPLYRPR